MKNLFDYATKELSQDAFLRWLFENYNCENESVKKAFRKLFDSFTDGKFKSKEITDLETVAQWKNIDISIWFKVDGDEHLLVIEDKTGSEIHNDQLKKYSLEIKKHSDFWKNEEHQKAKRSERHIENDQNIFKIFYKTNVIDQWENDNAKSCGWKIYDIYSIYELFSDINTDNEVLGYYQEYIQKTYSAAKREIPLNEWNLISWHSFFNDYQTPDCISPKKDINCYQKEYYYIKFFIKGHENDMPCVEIRSRDLIFDEAAQTCSLPIRIVLYNLLNQADQQTIKSWQDSLKEHEFKLNHRKNVSKHKQIGTKYIRCINSTEKDLTATLDSINNLLSSLF